MKIFSLIPLVLSALFLSVPGLKADPGRDDLDLPVSRYVLNNPASKRLSNWNGLVSLQILGKGHPQLALDAVAQIRSFADHAGESFQMVGNPLNWFAGIRYALPETTYFIVYDHFEGLDDAASYRPFEGSGINFDAADPAVKKLLSRGVARRGEGCFADWVADGNNNISAFVVVADTSKFSYIQDDCLKSVIPSSFGVANYITKLHVEDYSRTQMGGVFWDTSEIVLLLRLAAFCRKELLDPTPECPATMLQTLYQYHSELLSRYFE